jgi:hypothetical protein
MDLTLLAANACQSHAHDNADAALDSAKTTIEAQIKSIQETLESSWKPEPSVPLGEEFAAAVKVEEKEKE